MSMSAPSRVSIDVRALEIEAILGLSSIAASCQVAPTPYLLVDEEEDEDEDEADDEGELGWDDDDEEDIDEDDE